jgi:hypothetical protein
LNIYHPPNDLNFFDAQTYCNKTGGRLPYQSEALQVKLYKKSLGYHRGGSWMLYPGPEFSGRKDHACALLQSYKTTATSCTNQKAVYKYRHCEDKAHFVCIM